MRGSSRIGRTAALTALCLALLAGCGGASTNLPTFRGFGGSGPTGIHEGRLVADPTCLWIENIVGDRFLVVWPAGYWLNGRSIENRSNEVIAHVGDSVELGGAVYDEAQYDFVSGLMIGSISPACRGHGYSVVVSVISARPGA